MSCVVCQKDALLACHKCSQTFCSKECVAMIGFHAEDMENVYKMTPDELLNLWNKTPSSRKFIDTTQFKRKYVTTRTLEEWDKLIHFEFRKDDSDLSFVQAFLPSLIKMKAWFPTKRTNYFMLQYAAQRGDIALVKTLLSILSRLERGDFDPKQSVLSDALAVGAVLAKRNTIEMIDLLIARGADPASENNKALRVAVDNNATLAVKHLLSIVRISIDDINKMLQRALRNGNVEAAELLIPNSTLSQEKMMNQVEQDRVSKAKLEKYFSIAKPSSKKTIVISDDEEDDPAARYEQQIVKMFNTIKRLSGNQVLQLKKWILEWLSNTDLPEYADIEGGDQDLVDDLFEAHFADKIKNQEYGLREFRNAFGVDE